MNKMIITQVKMMYILELVWKLWNRLCDEKETINVEILAQQSQAKNIGRRSLHLVATHVLPLNLRGQTSKMHNKFSMNTYIVVVSHNQIKCMYSNHVVGVTLLNETTIPS